MKGASIFQGIGFEIGMPSNPAFCPNIETIKGKGYAHNLEFKG
jgi:hypothetical protein